MTNMLRGVQRRMWRDPETTCRGAVMRHLPPVLALFVMFALPSCNGDFPVPETSTPATPSAGQTGALVDAAEDIVAFLRGELEFDSITTADSVTLRLAPEGGGDSTRVARELLREPANWSVRAAASGAEYPLAPPATLTILTTREGRHFNCQDYALSSRVPELAGHPHVGTRLEPPDRDSCLQTWNLTLVFDPHAPAPVLVAAVYDQWEW